MASAPAPGTLFDKGDSRKLYALENKIAEGAYGTVYAAKHKGTEDWEPGGLSARLAWPVCHGHRRATLSTRCVRRDVGSPACTCGSLRIPESRPDVLAGEFVLASAVLLLLLRLSALRRSVPRACQVISTDQFDSVRNACGAEGAA